MVNIKGTLSPSQAATAAKLVYGLKQNNNIERVFEPGFNLNQSFSFNSTSSRFTAQSGAFTFKSETGFGVLAMGKEGTQFEKQALLVCRGTDGLKDWLTDFNVSMHRSVSGNNVHAGFRRTFDGFQSEIQKFLNLNQPSKVHCVGHSLGGALANLSADFILKKHTSRVSLYTFGAPRVGDQSFANNLTSNPKLGKKNIHRVYHSGDPVAMIPVWPFTHAPLPNGECYIEKNIGFNPFQHKMSNYAKSVERFTKPGDWNMLRFSHPTWDHHCIEWVTSPKNWQLGGLNLYNLNMVSLAIQMAVKKVLGKGFVCVGVAVKGGATILDQLSYYLLESSKQSAEDKNFVVSIMRRILEMCHVKYDKGTSITKTFVQFVLRTLMLAIAAPVRLALSSPE